MQKNKPPSRALCSGMVFSIVGEKSPSYVLNKYKLGRVQGSAIILNPFEALHLFLKGKISAENPVLNSLDRLLERLGLAGQFLDVFIVYDILKSRGMYVKLESGSLFYRKTPREEFRGPVRVIRESEDIEFREMVDNGACIYAAIDDDNDVTIFLAELWDGHGQNEFNMNPEYDITEMDGTSLTDASRVPQWYGTLIGNMKLLNRSEVNFLKNITPEEMENPLLQMVFNDLIHRNFIVKTGFKYGANFRIYAGSIEEHADYLVHVVKNIEQWYKISRAVRVAQGVRKEMVFSGIIDRKTEYIKLKRVRDPFRSEN